MISNQNKNLNLNKTGNKTQEFKDPVQIFYESLHSPHRKNLFLRVCISAGNSQYSSIKKIRVVEKRGLEIVQLNCSKLFLSNVKQVKQNVFADKVNKNDISLNLLNSFSPSKSMPLYLNENNDNQGNYK